MNPPTPPSRPPGLSTDTLLIFLPALPPDPTWISATEARHPGLTVRWHSGAEADIAALPAAVWDGVTLLMCYRPPPAELVPRVRFVQLTSAGADRWLGHEVYTDGERGVVFCNASGTHSTQIAEWVLGMWIMSQHCFLRYAESMKAGTWGPRYELPIEDSPGLRMGILGYGAIGRQCARLGQAMGMEIYAFTRSEKPTSESRRDDAYCVAGTGDAEGLLPSKWYHGADREAVNRFLAQDLDLLVISLPLTTGTTKIIGREQFEILSKKKTFVANIARGKHIDTDALLDALKDNKIRGAALDVTDPEPLPTEHPLWRAPNVFITPHVSWQTPHYWQRCVKILEINLEKLASGATPINLINKAENY